MADSDRRSTCTATTANHAKGAVRPASIFAGIAAVLLGAGCGDNEACVFGPGNCQGGTGGGGIGGALGTQASLPFDGQLVVDGPPTVTALFPENGASSTTPIVLIFSEAIAVESVEGAILIQESIDVLGQGGLPVLAIASLLGDGRVLALLPQVGLTAGATYEVRLRDDAELRDLTGQLLAFDPGALLGTFTVAATDPEAPRLVATYPPDGETGQSTTTELVAVFDRLVSAASVTTSSFVVTVEGGPAVFDPVPMPLESEAGPIPIDDTRVFSARLFNEVGEVVPFPTGVEVGLELSPDGAPILAQIGGAELENVTRSFDTQQFNAPLGVALGSDPGDAIGVANLTSGSSSELSVEVGLMGAQAGDRVGLLLFGTEPGEEGDLIALLRSADVVSGDTDLVTFDLAGLDLVLESDPLELRFVDGAVALAARLERGLAVSALRVLDADPDADGIQDLVLDTVPPELVDLAVPGGGGDMYSADVRDLVIAGLASEELLAVEVTTSLGDNGDKPEALGADAGGAFLAAPVPLGAVDPGDLPLPYTVVLYDRALNASPTPVEGLFRQVGRVGPDALAPGATVAVHVFDATTLQPVVGAVVATHADAAGYPLVDDAATGSGGNATVDAAGAGAAGTILTVVAGGYDAFTYHGLASSRLDVPLHPAPALSATTEGVITTADTLVSFFLPILTVRLGDSRRDPGASPFEPFDCSAGGGIFGGGELECEFGPEPIRARRLGAQSLLAGELSLDEVTFSAPGVIQAFELRLPALPAAPGSAEVAGLDVSSLLTGPLVAPEEAPREISPSALDLNLTFGVDLGSLVDDPATTGAPAVVLEAVVPGLGEPVLVGLGNAFDQSGGLYVVRAAIPGTVDAGGPLAERGVVDPDLFLRVEVRDAAGNLAAKRPRLSRLPDLPVPFTLFPGSVPQLVEPEGGGTVSGPSYLVTFSDTLVDLTGESGLYHVTLTDSMGARWHLWRPDPPDPPAGAGDVSILVPDLSGAGASGLADGAVTFEVELLAYPGLDPGDLFWSDLAREVDTYASGAPESFTQE